MNKLFYIQDKYSKQFLEGWDFNTILLTRDYMDAHSYFLLKDAEEVLLEIKNSNNTEFLGHNENQLSKVDLEIVQINFIPVKDT